MNGKLVARAVLAALLAPLFCVPALFAGSVTLVWDPVTLNTDDTPAAGLQGYRVYQATSSFLSPVVLSTGQARALSGVATYETTGTTFTVTGLAAGATYYFRVTAFDGAGRESAFNLDVSGFAVEVSSCISSRSDALLPTLDPASYANPEVVNSAQEDLCLRVQALPRSGTSLERVGVSFDRFGRARSPFFAMRAITGSTGGYEVVIPSTMTALFVGDLRYRIEARDDQGRTNRTPERVVRVIDTAQAQPDANGTVTLPHRHPVWGKSGADFARIPASQRPRQVMVRQLDPAGFAAVSDPLIDPSCGGRPVVMFEYVADGRDATLFPAAVRLTLAYPDLDPAIDASRLRVFCREPGGRWVLIGGTVNAGRHAVTAETRHFSVYGLFPVKDLSRVPGEALAKAREHFITPARRDGYNDAAHFGINARQVEIFSLDGHRVFGASGDGLSSIQWTACDEAGNAVESGAYIAKITDADGRVYYQSIIVAK